MAPLLLSLGSETVRVCAFAAQCCNNQQFAKPRMVMSCGSSLKEGRSMTPDEELIYEQRLSQKKVYRSKQLQEIKRRRAFDPTNKSALNELPARQDEKVEHPHPSAKLNSNLQLLQEKQQAEVGLDTDDVDDLDYDALGEFEAWMEADASTVKALSTAESAIAKIPSTGSKPDPLSDVEAQVLELEELSKVLRLLDEQESSKNGHSPPTISESDINWKALGKALFGDNIQSELEACFHDEERQSSSTSVQEAHDAVRISPWLDEVTTLLLGLVDMSHHCYLEVPLLPSNVTEDTRAATVWTAPYLVFVQDDASIGSLEYMNQTALHALGYDYYDIFQLTSFDLVPSTPDAQQDWLWSLKEAEDAFEKYHKLPELALKTKKGEIVFAKEVVIFRLDNLEGEYIGQVVIANQFSGPA